LGIDPSTRLRLGQDDTGGANLFDLLMMNDYTYGTGPFDLLFTIYYWGN
jgi:hypothetical protein